MREGLHYATLTEVCQRMKSGELSAVQVAQHTLERIARVDGALKSYARLMPDSALATAERLDQARADGMPLGALHGVPVAIKDLFNTKGVATACGTRILADFVPQSNARVVDRLRSAGAVIVGKTQLTEGAFSTHHPDIDPPQNPWSADHWAGVSSSGSGVSVAAGLAYGALGTDTGGSIRFPSACCGLVGIKPTFGRVSKFGAFPLALSMDHVGPMTRSTADAARMLQVLAGHDPADPDSLTDAVPNYAERLHAGVRGLCIGVDWSYVEQGVDPVVVQAVRAAATLFAELGAEVREVTVPPTYRALVEGWGVSCGVECARAHKEYFPAREKDYGPALAALIRLGLQTPDEHYDRLHQLRNLFRSQLDGVLREADGILMPAMPVPPPLQQYLDNGAPERTSGQAEMITFTAPFNYSGHPSITLPVGLSEAGLPLSVQVVGRRLDEATLLQLGSALEKELDLRLRPIP